VVAVKRYLIGAAVVADAVFTLTLDADTWQRLIVFVAIAAAIILAVFAIVERSEIKAERRRSQRLAGWIQDHHEGTPFQPYDGDDAERSRFGRSS
jgi:membrane protein implicated in regulation of membrane protease activity